MNQDRPAPTALDRLPTELVDRLTRPLGWFPANRSAGRGGAAPGGVAALVPSNSPWAEAFLAIRELPVGYRVGSFELVRSAREWINDGLMTLYFRVGGLTWLAVDASGVHATLAGVLLGLLTPPGAG